MNKGIRNSSGEVIGFLHADDLFANDDVLATIAYEFSDPEVDAVYGDLVYVSQHDVGRVIRYWRAGDFIPDALRRGWMPPHPTLYVRQSVYERAGLFDSELKIAADYDSIIRIFSLSGLNARCIHEVLIRMRAGGASNWSLSNVIRKSRQDLSTVRKNKIGGLYMAVLLDQRHEVGNRAGQEGDAERCAPVQPMLRNPLVVLATRILVFL